MQLLDIYSFLYISSCIYLVFLSYTRVHIIWKTIIHTIELFNDI